MFCHLLYQAIDLIEFNSTTAFSFFILDFNF